MSKSCMNCKDFKYKLDKNGNAEFWKKGDCLHTKTEVYDAGVCRNFKKNIKIKKV